MGFLEKRSQIRSFYGESRSFDLADYLEHEEAEQTLKEEEEAPGK